MRKENNGEVNIRHASAFSLLSYLFYFTKQCYQLLNPKNVDRDTLLGHSMTLKRHGI